MDKVAEAIYQSAVKSAREEVDSLEFDANELPDLFQRLRNESETAKILIFASYLEDRVTSLIKLRLHHLDSVKIEKEIFGSNGPLGTFGGRLALSYQLGWISRKQKARLDAFKHIRNEFAHRAFYAKFSDANISARFENLDYDVFGVLARVREAIEDLAEEHRTGRILEDNEISEDMQKLIKLLLFAGDTLSDLLVLPSARGHQVSPHDIRHSANGESKAMMNIARAMSRAALGLIVEDVSGK